MDLQLPSHEMHVYISDSFLTEQEVLGISDIKGIRIA